MKNISKKWSLFIIATFVTFLGIGYTLLKGTQATSEVPVNPAFDDMNFYKCIVDAYNSKNGTNVGYDTNLTDEQLGTITNLSCSNKGIISAKGVENLIGLKTLELSSNELVSLNIIENTELTSLDVRGNQLTSLDLKENILLNRVDAGYNQLKELDVSQNTGLTSLNLYYNQLTNLDISVNVALTFLSLGINQLKDLDLGQNDKLTSLDVRGNQLTSLDLKENILLNRVDAGYNQLTSLDVSQNMELTTLDISNNEKLIELELGNINKITNLNASNNKLTTINVSNNILLTDLDVSYNELINLDVSKNISLANLNVRENKLTNINLYYNELLEILDLCNNSLINLDVSNNKKMKSLYLYGNRLTSLDVNQNLELINLSVYSNKLSYLDLSNNLSLKNIWLGSNPWNEILYLYRNSKDVVGNNVKLPSHLSCDVVSFSSSDESVISVDNERNITALMVGSANVNGNVSCPLGNYLNISTINVVEITSDKYVIDEENSYINVGSDTDVDVIKNNISKSNDDITIDVDMDNYKLYVEHDDEVLKEFNIIGYSSSEYDLSKDYIYVGTSSIDVGKIDTVNCDSEVNTTGDKLLIKYGDLVLDEYKLVSVSSEKYDLSKEYIYAGNAGVDTGAITVINGEIKVNETGDKLLIKYGDLVLDEYKLVSLSSEKYDLSKDYIYVGNNSVNTNAIIVINGDVLVDATDNKLLIKYGTEVLDEYEIIGFSLTNYRIVGNKVIISEENNLYDDFLNSFSGNTGIEGKIFSGLEEFTGENILDGMIFKVLYNGVVLDEYVVSNRNEYVQFNSNLIVNDSSLIVSNITSGTIFSDIIVDTNGEVSLLDKDDNILASSSKLKTGDKIKAVFSDYELVYTISVTGDIDGDGNVNDIDLRYISDHLIKGNVISGDVYLKTADIDNNDNININDVIKLSRLLNS